ncbi:MAG: cytochrome o ubiquinol oxidase subunit IV [Rhizobiaceae bacterium]
MSSDAHATHAADGHHALADAPHGTLKGYLTGFVLAVVLTVIPFWLVMGNVLDNAVATGILIMIFAVVQIVVHMIYFLHLDARSEGGWNMLALIFTVVLVVIGIVGSLWVMYHLDLNMMPGMMTGHPG